MRKSAGSAVSTVLVAQAQRLQHRATRLEEAEQEDDGTALFGGAAPGNAFSPARAPPAPPVLALSTAEVATNDGSSSATFAIPRPATIASDNDAHKVSITVLTLKPSFTHVVVPRCVAPGTERGRRADPALRLRRGRRAVPDSINTNAYIKASVTNDSSFPLLPGPLNVFIDGSFITQTALELTAPREEFALFLGADMVRLRAVSAPRDARPDGRRRRTSR
jgi:hypothetical protein